jgi:hypothetical protein
VVKHSILRSNTVGFRWQLSLPKHFILCTQQQWTMTRTDDIGGHGDLVVGTKRRICDNHSSIPSSKVSGRLTILCFQPQAMKQK